MPRSLRTDLLLSHLLLVVLLLGVCLIAVAGFFRLGQSVNRILENNYKSVVAAQNMKESLERLDDAATFFVAGQTEEARKQARENVPRFENAYRTEASNITENGEQALSDDLGKQFAIYKTGLSHLLNTDPPISAEESHALYFKSLEPQLMRVKGRVQDILNLNQTAILRANEQAKTRHGRRAFGASLLPLSPSLAVYHWQGRISPL